MPEHLQRGADRLAHCTGHLYVDFLGLKVGMDLGWIVTFVSPSNPTAQIRVMRDDNPSTPLPKMSIEVAD